MFAPETRHTRTPLAALCNLHRACLHTLAKKVQMYRSLFLSLFYHCGCHFNNADTQALRAKHFRKERKSPNIYSPSLSSVLYLQAL